MALPVDDEPAAIVLQPVKPDVQLERLIALFEGSRAASPAAALAQWRKSRKNATSLGKGLEAAIAVLNPEMVAEVKPLDGSEIVVDFDVASGEPHWFAAFPRDDGTLAAVGTALALTDGKREPPLEESQLDRLGPPGSAMMTQNGQWVVVAGAREDLKNGLELLKTPRVGGEPGAWLRVNPGHLARARSVTSRRIGLALQGAHVGRLDAFVTLKDEQLAIEAKSEAPDPRVPPVDAKWMDFVPDSAAVAFAYAFDPSREAWDSLFTTLDAIEKADPANAKLATVRAQVNLFATLAGVKPEVDLWPKLRAVWGHVAMDRGTLTGAVIHLDLVDAASAERIRDEVVPKVAKSLRADPGDLAGGLRDLGVIANRRMSVASRGSRVVIAWGPMATVEPPEHSAAGILAPRLGTGQVHRCVVVWPGRIHQFEAESPLAAALEKSPPAIWWGRGDRDWASLPNLKPTIQRFLDRLPMEATRR